MTVSDLTKETTVYCAQERWIREMFGDKAAERANYGWFVDEIDRTVGTKIYGEHAGVVQTSFDHPTSHLYSPWD